MGKQKSSLVIQMVRNPRLQFSWIQKCMSYNGSPQIPQHYKLRKHLMTAEVNTTTTADSASRRNSRAIPNTH